MNSLKYQIVTRIRAKGRGHVYFSKDFLDLGGRGTIDVTLSNLAKSGFIRRLSRGLYDYPRYNVKLGGELSPAVDQVAEAIARKRGWHIIAFGALAANLLGLSEQVPAKVVYLSNGPSKIVNVERLKIHFKHAEPKEMRIKSSMSNLVFQALRCMGKNHVDNKVVRKIQRMLKTKDRRRLIKDARYQSDWIYEMSKKISAEGDG